jgi:hypothetical protein
MVRLGIGLRIGLRLESDTLDEVSIKAWFSGAEGKS